MNKQILIKYPVPFICLGLSLLTFAGFEQVRNNDFISYDDFQYVSENVNVKEGLSVESFVWAFTSGHASNWHPLTWISHMIDCQLYGLDPAGHHMTNLLLHTLTVLCLFWFLKTATGAIWPSAFVAAVFAIHPLHVESVAWIAERKDVLCGLFWMLTMAAYLRYVKGPRIGRYLLVTVCFCLGLMAKPMIVTLPFVLLLLDYWPLDRFQLRPQKGKGISIPYRLIAEKIPLFILAAASSMITFMVQIKARTITDIVEIPFFYALLNGLTSYTGYLVKMIYPVGLAILYPHPGRSIALWQPIVSVAILAGLTVFFISSAKRRPYLTVGWLWYLGTLVPVIGIVQVGRQAMADRYTYLPAIGIFIIIAWGAGEILAKWRYRKFIQVVLAGTVLVGLLLCTRIQVGHWQNSLTLYDHTLRVTENNYTILTSYGKVLAEYGRNEDAIKCYEKALQINPYYAPAHYNFASSLKSLGKHRQAIEHFQQALKLQPDGFVTLNNLAWTLATVDNEKFRDPAEAVRFAERACELTQYSQPMCLDTLAAAYAADGDFAKAVEMAEKALQLTGDNEEMANDIRKHIELFKTNKPYIAK